MRGTISERPAKNRTINSLLAPSFFGTLGQIDASDGLYDNIYIVLYSSSSGGDSMTLSMPPSTTDGVRASLSHAP